MVGTVEVVLLGVFGDAAGTGVARVRVGPHDTVGSVIDRVSKRHGRGLSESVRGSEGKVASGAVVLLNGVSVQTMRELETPVRGGDRLFLSPRGVGG